MTDPGRFAVAVGFVCSTLAFLLYILADLARRRNRPSVGRLLRFARAGFTIAALASVFVFLQLMRLVVAKRFEYRYVFDYTSVDLHGAFLYAATWAGQEGSFALWAMLASLIGLLMTWKAGDWETRVMPVYISHIAVLFAVLHILSPFVLVPKETGLAPSDWPAGMPWPPPWPPADGNGLNPSLQNYWMAIHPPTIFFGFASLAVPFSYAIAAMLYRAYDEWVAHVTPYVLLTVATLGAGLFVGGYWAYETQGWHGFWAWDPVENASLFPWLGTLALAHGLVVQRSRGGMIRTNLFLAIASWLLFVYGTFLTRSGALANFSVHAFGMLDSPALKLLVGMIVVHGLLGVGLLIVRWRSIKAKPVSDAVLSRDTAMWLAVMVMSVAAAMICIGTSWPLISRWPWLRGIPFLKPFVSAEGVRVEAVFYNRLGTALMIPTLLALGAVPFLSWGKTDPERFMRRLMAPWLAAIVGGGLILWFVLHEVAIGFQADTPRAVTVALATLGFFAAIANAVLVLKLIRKQRMTMGGWLSHAGVGLLLIGTVLTNVYEKTSNYSIVEGRGPVRTEYGYSLEFVGWTHEGKSDEEVLKAWKRFDHAVLLRVTPNGAGQRPYLAHVAVFKYWNASKGEWSTMTWPDIRKQAHRDIYLAAADDPRLVRPMATLRPGETSTVGVPGLGPTGYSVRYDRFVGGSHGGSMASSMTAEMTLITPAQREIKINPGISFAGGDPQPTNVAIREIGGAAIIDGGIDPQTKELTIALELPDAPAIWVVPIAATNKPMINLVWLGVLLIVGGALIAMVRRIRDRGQVRRNIASREVEANA